MGSTLPTIIIRDPREQTKKCSIYPLKGKREDLLVINHPPKRAIDFSGYVRLAPDAPELSEDDTEKGLLLIDASWRWARKITREYEEVEPRSLRGWHTAFPRVSNLGTDPDEGLATVEALYIAFHILDRETEGLLDEYRWAEEFLDLNGFRE